MNKLFKFKRQKLNYLFCIVVFLGFQMTPEIDWDVPKKFQNFEKHDQSDASEKTKRASQRRDESINLEDI